MKKLRFVLAVAAPFLFLQLQCAPDIVAPASAKGLDCVTKILHAELSSDQALVFEKQQATRLLSERKIKTAYPRIPSVDQISVAPYKPRANWDKPLPLSFGAGDARLERARDLHVVDDYKELSDLVPKDPKLRVSEEGSLNAQAFTHMTPADEKQHLAKFIQKEFQKPHELKPVPGLALPRWTLNHADPKLRAAFKYTEQTWSKLLRETHPVEGGSLLASPYPVLIPAGRFQESYYWDTYFANQALIETGRLDIAQMQVENFLSSIRKYGFVPNGGRDYYLSRSQPPFISSMVREVYEASLARAKTPAEKEHLKRWLKERAYPLLKKDYEKFWMNPKTRYDAKTGLNHHWDDINLPRPERHGADNELELGDTYRDVRAGAESGLDFTSVVKGKDAHVATPLLNSMLFKTENDLSWAARELGLADEAKNFLAAANRRRAAINRYLWDPKKGHYASWMLGRHRRVEALSADTFGPLFVGAADQAQAAEVRNTLQILEKRGGIMASELRDSPHQWDGANGWAPFQVMAISGLERYGFAADSKRIAEKWVNAVAQVHSESGTFYERIDVEKIKKPDVDAHKYPTQEGFLWTNGSFVWAAVKALRIPISPL